MDRKTKSLLKKLGSDDAKIRYDAVMALGKTGNTELIERLDKVANLDNNMKVRDLASKAVRTLEILEKRRRDQERQQMEVEEEGEDGGLVWRPLMKDKLFDEQRQFNIEAGNDDWDYVRAKKLEKELTVEQMRQREEYLRHQAEAAELARQRRRRPFRIFLILVTMFMCVVGVFAIWYMLNVESPPDSRTAALEDMRTLLQEQSEIVAAYQTQLGTAGAVNCTALSAIHTPERPRWIELVITSESVEDVAGVMERTADDLNRIDDTLLSGLDITLTEMDLIHASLLSIEDTVQTVCSGRESLEREQWDRLAAQFNINDLLLIAEQSALSAESTIAQAFPPTDRAQALAAMQQIIGNQQAIILNYEAQLATDPLNCPALTAVTVSTPPGWATSVSASDGMLDGLELVVEAINSIEVNLRTIQQAALVACEGRVTLAQAEWSAYNDAVQLKNESFTLADSASAAVFAADSGS